MRMFANVIGGPAFSRGHVLTKFGSWPNNVSAVNHDVIAVNIHVIVVNIRILIQYDIDIISRLVSD
jgi:hypothetical protein